MTDALLDLERTSAKERQIAAGARGTEGGRGKRKTLTAHGGKGLRRKTSMERAAKGAGASGTTYRRVKEVLDAVKEDPSLADIAEKMDETGNVTGRRNSSHHATMLQPPPWQQESKIRNAYFRGTTLFEKNAQLERDLRRPKETPFSATLRLENVKKAVKMRVASGGVKYRKGGHLGGRPPQSSISRG